MRAIPKKLLTHSADVYQESKTGSGWDGATLEMIGRLAMSIWSPPAK